jgi:outer membrane immunogenic protein
MANATPKEKLTMQTTNFSKIVCAIGALVVGVFLACSAPNAHAGEFKNIVPTVTPETEYRWDGPYLAFNSGAVWTNFDISGYDTRVDLTKQFNSLVGTGALDINDTFFSESAHSSTEAAYMGGVDLGYNFQFGHFVVGPVFGFSGTKTRNGSIARSFQSNTIVITDPVLGPAVDTADTRFDSFRHTEENWSGYAGSQAVVAWQRFLFYANGGSAFSQIDVRTFDQASTEFFDAAGAPITNPNNPGQTVRTDNEVNSTNNILTGWFVGGGMQFAFTDKLRAGLEYRHADFGNRLYDFPNRGAIHAGATRVDVVNNEVLFKVSIMLGHLGKATH